MSVHTLLNFLLSKLGVNDTYKIMYRISEICGGEGKHLC
jgi:hypothetical protein